MNSVAFWTLETQAIQMSVRWASDLLSGQILPLSLFPGVFGRIVEHTPFAAIYSVPLEIYIGQIGPAQYLPALLTQLAWLVLFAIAGVFVWRSAERRVVVQGG